MEKLPTLYGKILIADDEKVNVDFFQVMFSKLGFDVDVAKNGEEVLEKAKTFHPDLIILDILMPKIDGFEVAKILKKEEVTKNIPIIVLTAVNDVKEKVDMLELGIEDYIIKPYNFIEILARIRNILKSKYLKDELLKRESRLNSIERLREAIEKFLMEIREYANNLINTSEEGIKDRTSYDKDFVKYIRETGNKLLNSIGRFEKEYKDYTAVSQIMNDLDINLSALDEFLKKGPSKKET